MKSLIDLWCALADDISKQCGCSTTRDKETVARRVENEGLSFLTITLPSFCSDLQKGLERGHAGPDLWVFFKSRGSTPRFLGDLLDRIFDRASGELLDVPDTDSIWAIRQLTSVFGKIELPCSLEREARAVEAYIQCENEVRESDRVRQETDVSRFISLATMLYGDVLCTIDREVYDQVLIPRHGPGATADRLRGNAKFDQKEWPERLDTVFPFGEYAIPNWRYSYLLDGVDFVEPGRERPVRVVLVPKTLKTPRVIAIEPTSMQYAQQAISRRLVELLESSWIRQSIGFTDQGPNRTMAEKGSYDGSLATLDLSEASDRVSNQLVRAMLSHWPHLRGGVDATRSRKADVPGHGVIRLAKFASMGSALTFPIEAMVFLTIIFVGIEKSLGSPLSKKDVESLLGQVRVYGDDLIVPNRHAISVIQALEDFGLRVNQDKSFLNGRFRESCGKEYYAGVDTSVVKVRRPLPRRKADSAEIVSAVSLRNQFYYAGCWTAASWLDRWVGALGVPLPRVASTSAGLGRNSFLGYDTERTCPNLHAPRVRAMVVKPLPPTSKVSGEGALLKCLLNEGLPLAKDHLIRTGRSGSVRTKTRWVQPF